MYFNRQIIQYTGNYSEQIERLRSELHHADAIVIGAGAGLSTSAGFMYTGERFQKYFADFSAKYHFFDMYSGGFYPYSTLEEYWAYWSRYIFINRYTAAPLPVYNDLYQLVKNKDYFVLTTNVDHQFQKAGFDKGRLFYTQGDYGLWQCVDGCGQKTYDNELQIQKMVVSQGYVITPDNQLILPEGVTAKMSIPSELIPYCPTCGKPMTMNLRADRSFVEDEGWKIAAQNYNNFKKCHRKDHILYLELGVGANTPTIIKYPFWQSTIDNPQAVYCCMNFGEAFALKEIEKQSIVIDEDIRNVLFLLFVDHHIA